MPAAYVDGRSKYYDSNHAKYSTGDYCESPDSCSHRKTDTVECMTSPRPAFRLPLHPRCTKKYYRITNAGLPKPKYSSKQILRPSGRRSKRDRQMEDTTSVDEHKSITSYSSILTVDVNREMEAVNRDIKEIIRRCDDYCQQVTNHSECCHFRHRKVPLKGSEARLISSKRRPANRLKELPMSVMKPKSVRRHYVKEKSLLATPRNSYKASRDIRNIVDETDALLRNVYKELSRGKRQDLQRTDCDSCRCDGHPPPIGWTSHPHHQVKATQRLDKFIHYKCPRLRLNTSYYPERLFLPKWKHLFERSLGRDEWTRHNHDTNCISDSSCFLKTKGVFVRTTDAQVNTESTRDAPPKENKCICQGKPSNRPSDPIECKEVKSVALQCRASSSSDDKPARNAVKEANGRRVEDSAQAVTGCDRSPAANEIKHAASLLLDRDMGLVLNTTGKANKTNESTDSGVQIASSKDLGSTIGLRKRYYSHDYSGIVSKNCAGGSDESITALESSKTFISQMVTKIVSAPPHRMQTSPLQTLVESDNLEKRDQEVDSAICLEIMKRLVDLIMNNHQKQIDRYVDVPAQYGRVRKMKQEHLVNIEREINSIQDLEFYLRNATLSKS